MGRRRVEGSAANTAAATPTTVPVTSIAHSPRNPRDTYEDVADLAASMEQVGVLQPLGVVRYEVYLARYPEHETEIGSAHWVVIQGNRRLAAARHAQLPDVPVIVQDRIGRQGTFDESTLIENVHRTDLPPLREAALLQVLVEKHGSQRQAAKAVGKTSGWVTQRLSLLKLVPQLQARLSTGELTIIEARELAQFPQSRQLQAYANGAPYKDPAKPKPQPAPGVDPADRSTYTRTEVSLPPEGAYGVSTPGSGGAGSNDGHRAEGAEGASQEASAYAVSTSASPENVNGAGEGAYGVSTQLRAAAPQFSEQPDRTLPPPEPLVAAIEREYTAEQRQEVLRLLQS